MTDPWSTWCLGVLSDPRLHAGTTQTNVDTLFAWSCAETLPFLLMRWNNPLDTTQPEPGSVSVNSVGVQSYPTIAEGIDATVVTLLNGHYSTIVDHLRRSVPRAQWADCCAQLNVWGTGCAWISRDFGIPPQIGEDMNSTDVKGVLIAAAHGCGRGGPLPSIPGGHAVTQADINGSAARYVAGTATLDTLVAEIVSTPDAIAFQAQVAALLAAGTAQGPAGPQGPQGPAGPAGPAPTQAQIVDAVVAWVRSVLPPP